MLLLIWLRNDGVMKLTESTPQRTLLDGELDPEYEAALAWVMGKIVASPTVMLNARAKRQ
ncbi:hypothetical protein KDK_11050 [Dictyobacter kobayashii]|uniref:Uncharacterized protein n=1 Tax=Dictyobacter kobayashii TaxID=2014872 RepID=A0A402ADY5_9CHLR|nr:hypothetical protein KDK_11050 [Dictyobacter kobayashii]